jgi:hypothetical protein
MGSKTGDKSTKAWNLYLAQTRRLNGIDYEEVEPREWKKLMTALKEARSEKLAA